MFLLARPSFFIVLVVTVSAAESQTWVSLPMNVPQNLSDLVFDSPTVPTLFGTPPQVINSSLDLNTAKLAVYSSDCVLCAGNTSFDVSMSSTAKSLNYSWAYSTLAYSGNVYSDTFGFGGLLQVANIPFGLIETGGDPGLAYMLYNGRLGLFPDPLNATAASQHFLLQMYQSGQLLNPVVGMRFDPMNPKITIGALDPNDYQGQINWVPLTTPNATWTFQNTFMIDGLKGYNGSFLPQSENLLAALDSLWTGISMPNVDTYVKNQGFAGNVHYSLNYKTGVASYVCNSTVPPYVALTATINGVDYPMDSLNNLLRPLATNIAPAGCCPIAPMNRSTTLPNLNFGLPFLRSIYLAYRFPTDGCPGFYGFAFPSGPVNRTAAQLSQTPTSTPTNSAQCLALIPPTSTPTPSFKTAQQMLFSTKKYNVYDSPQNMSVSLLGVENFPAIVWNSSSSNSN
ncbi:aspartic peptidase domain-containing protein [Suillus paluster]|uniref:aspartic peptidase domain-containing protein n=1 Tax=Suillus paluster TaxID=48578 RepID=UPI001B85BB63|nr:aspartic peptidase domain-containing protein [Suillus paluster]KAG1752304.1 aspartic peptidase domain-containing protein [Suillus paluster]